jgi:hypothetical protein
MRRLTIIFAMLCGAVALAAPAASASSRQLTVMQDDSLLYRQDGATREQTLDEFQALGADVVKVQIYWRDVAPAGRRKPSGFDAANPGSYSWGTYDEVVRSIIAHGMRPFLTLGNTAPDWATAKVTRRRGIYKPSAKEFELFAEAVGTRYSGSYAGIPRVELWSIWNEPNLYSWLSPQRSGGAPVSPSLYRNLYLAAHRGLEATGHGADTILLGELMPRAGTDLRKVSPTEFLRELVCLDRNYRQYTGTAAKRRGCKKVGRIPTSGIAYHPYTAFRGGPHGSVSKGDATIATLSRITKMADKLARKGKLPSRLPLWITEFGYQTNPPDPLQDPIRLVPGYMDESEWIAFRNPRVRSYSQYTLIDEPDTSSWQAGLRFHGGKAKPGVYDAFRLPALVRTPSATKAEIWGGLRTAASGSTATIESRVGGGTYSELGTAKLNAAGYFRKTFSVKNPNKRIYRITIDGRTREKRPVR